MIQTQVQNKLLEQLDTTAIKWSYLQQLKIRNIWIDKSIILNICPCCQVVLIVDDIILTSKNKTHKNNKKWSKYLILIFRSMKIKYIFM